MFGLKENKLFSERTLKKNSFDQNSESLKSFHSSSDINIWEGIKKGSIVEKESQYNQEAHRDKQMCPDK